MLSNQSLVQILFIYSISAVVIPWLIIVVFVVITGIREDGEIVNVLIRGLMSFPLAMWVGPLIVGTIFMAYLVSSTGDFPPGTIIGFVFLTSAFLTSSLLISLLLISVSSSVSEHDKSEWQRQFLIKPLVAVPVFWYEYIWKHSK